MWHALRAELAYSRPYLLGGMGLAVGVVIIVSVVFFAVGPDGPPSHVAAGLRAMFLMMAPLVVGFIVHFYRSEERRARLLLAGPLTPGQLAGATVLLPVILLAIGVLAAGLAIGTRYMFTGTFELESVHLVGFVGGQMFAYVQMAILAQEATAAHRQRRRRATVAGWASFVLAVLLLTAVCLVAALGILGSHTWTVMILGHLIVGVMAAMASVALYADRTDFTR